MGIEKLVRRDLVTLGSYSAHRAPETLRGQVEVAPEDIIKLDANENPYGCSPEVAKALSSYANWHIYPDASQGQLRQQLQEYTGASAERIVAACGSGELLDDILCLFAQPGDEVVNCIPTFDMYRIRALVNGARLVNISRKDDYAIDVSAIEKAITSRTRLLILANPNSPTGTVTPEADIRALADTGLPFLVDEAYYEFYGQTSLPLMDRYPNLMILRTFSKWAGLAGLRVGYGIFPPEIAGYLLKIKLPYNVNVAALIAVSRSLQDKDYLMERVSAIIEERERMFRGLEGLGWLKPVPSQANFILCSVLKGKAADLQQKLLYRGILVRYFDQAFLQNCIRISVGRPEQTDTLLRVLKELEAELDG